MMIDDHCRQSLTLKKGQFNAKKRIFAAFLNSKTKQGKRHSKTDDIVTNNYKNYITDSIFNPYCTFDEC